MNQAHDKFTQHLEYLEGQALISFHEPFTNAVYYAVDDLVLLLGYESEAKMLKDDRLLDALNDYRRNTGKSGFRVVAVEHMGQTTNCSVLAGDFLTTPEVAALFHNPESFRKTDQLKPAKQYWEMLLEKDTWTEEDISHLLAVLFIDYGVPGQRTASLYLLAEFAYDPRTPDYWAKRLQFYCQWMAENKREEIHLSELTRLETLFFNRQWQLASYLDISFC